jgi:hypothetical protein
MTEGIVRKKLDRNLVLEVDLDYAEQYAGKKALPLGIPIFQMSPYIPAPGLSDNYQSIRKWYRSNIDNYGGLIIFHRSDLTRFLSKAPADAVDYLVADDETERRNHEGWVDPINEAVEIRQWIFPANAINLATVTSDFNFENVRIAIFRSGKLVGEVYYSIKLDERKIFYSHSRQSKKPGS